MNEPLEKKHTREAHREAGHAVACYLLHKRFKYVTIKPDEEKLGKIIYPKITKRYPTEKQRQQFRRDVQVFIAGPVAEGILLGKTNIEEVSSLLSSEDKLIISSTTPRDPNDIILVSMKKDIGNIGELWKILFTRTKLLIYAPRNWQAITRLANRVLSEEKINYQSVGEIIRQSFEDYDNGHRCEISSLHFMEYSQFQQQESDARNRLRECLKELSSKL